MDLLFDLTFVVAVGTAASQLAEIFAESVAERYSMFAIIVLGEGDVGTVASSGGLRLHVAGLQLQHHSKIGDLAVVLCPWRYQSVSTC